VFIGFLGVILRWIYSIAVEMNRSCVFEPTSILIHLDVFTTFLLSDIAESERPARQHALLESGLWYYDGCD
jgi:hypothetical protein